MLNLLGCKNLLTSGYLIGSGVKTVHQKGEMIMSKAANWALVLIVCLLAIYIVRDRIIPTLVLQKNRGAYGRLVLDCEKARSSAQEARNKSFDDELVKKRFLKSIDVELISCLDRELLKNKLLGWGVTQPAIRVMELEVLKEETDISASTLTRPYAE